MSGQQSSVDVDVRSAVYNTAASSGRTAWDMLRTMYSAVRGGLHALQLGCEVPVMGVVHTVAAAACEYRGPSISIQQKQQKGHAYLI